MSEYTWKNLIYNPTLEEAKNAIGKECYFGSTPIGCIKNANDDKNLSVLREVRSNEFLPFITSNYGSYSCIIVKKEPSNEERAKKWIEENDLKVCDYVKVLRKTKLYENGWGGIWVDEMSDYIGKALKVLAINSLNGLISLECDDTVYVFPYFVLEKVEPPNPKYVPFNDKEEFLEAYVDTALNPDPTSFNGELVDRGIWLRCKDNDDLSQVTVIKECGICIDTMSTIVLWKNLLDDFEFIDGTPCGKLVEE